MIKRYSLRNQILEELAKLFKGYDIGDKLPSEIELSHQLGVSRNSVREAMKSLAIAGVINPQPGKGTFLVKEIVNLSDTVDGIIEGIDKSAYSELLEIRQILEVETAGIAARRVMLNSKEYADFKKSWEELKKILDNDDHTDIKCGRDFHRALAVLSQNRMIVKLLDNINEENENFRKSTLIKGDLQRELKIHEDIFNAVTEKNSEAAKESMREHMRYSREVLLGGD